MTRRVSREPPCPAQVPTRLRLAQHISDPRLCLPTVARAPLRRSAFLIPVLLALEQRETPCQLAEPPCAGVWVTSSKCGRVSLQGWTRPMSASFSDALGRCRAALNRDGEPENANNINEGQKKKAQAARTAVLVLVTHWADRAHVYRPHRTSAPRSHGHWPVCRARKRKVLPRK